MWQARYLISAGFDSNIRENSVFSNVGRYHYKT